MGTAVTRAPRPKRAAEVVSVRFVAVECALGVVGLGATDRGVCWLGLADTAEAAEQALRSALPWADVEPAGAALDEWLAEVLNRLQGVAGAELPLDMRGTEFQRRVWAALLAIPLAETRTYKQVAESLGMPDGFRAVARACATNPVAVLVPCHRVIGSDGGLHGYAYGLARKRALLDAEKRAVSVS